jgi:membrane protein
MARDQHQQEDADRGRQADRPSDIPKRGWKDILKRTVNRLRKDHISMVAGGMAFFIMLAIIPGMAAAIAIYGLAADPVQIQQQFESFKQMIPPQAFTLLKEQMQNIADSNEAAGWAAAISIVLALWSASKGIKALIEGLNIMYREAEKRNFIRLSLQALLMTLSAMVGAVIAISLIALLPAMLSFFGMDGVIERIVMYLRWPLLAGLFLLALDAIYRFGPSRDAAQWRWVTWGAAVATVLWLVVSGLFSFYVSNFDSYNKTYGSLAAVVILLMWLYLTSYVVLLGAEINTEMELQTAKDTTKGEPKPMGQRGAFAADNLG